MDTPRQDTFVRDGGYFTIDAGGRAVGCAYDECIKDGVVDVLEVDRASVQRPSERIRDKWQCAHEKGLPVS